MMKNNFSILLISFSIFGNCFSGELYFDYNKPIPMGIKAEREKQALRDGSDSNQTLDTPTDHKRRERR